MILDARYEKIRVDGTLVSCALLTAIGVDMEGKRRVLGCSVSLSEAETHWRAFLESLQARGLKVTTMITRGRAYLPTGIPVPIRLDPV